MSGAGRWRAALFFSPLRGADRHAPFSSPRAPSAPPCARPTRLAALARPCARPPAAQRAEARAERRARALRRSARRFLAAFCRYEVGEGGRALAVALRAAATPAFARRLLAIPPRPLAPAGYPPPARLGGLRISFLSAAGNRALVAAMARRGARAEQLSFVFRRRGRAWLASGPGQ